MKTIREMAEESANKLWCRVISPLSYQQHVDAYLAGAKAMNIAAYAIAFNGNGSDSADCAVNIAEQIKSLLPES